MSKRIFHKNSLLRRIFDYFSYLILRFFWLFFSMLPVKKSYAIGYKIGCRMYRICSSLRPVKVAAANIIHAGITDDWAEADRIAIASGGHFVGHIFEALRLSSAVDISDWKSYVDDSTNDVAKKLMHDTTQPIMICTGHLGSWEVAVPMISSFRPMFAVARLMDNPFVQKWLGKKHFRGTVTVVSKTNGYTPAVMRDWVQKNAAMTIVMDQHAGTGAKVKFFGHDVLAYTSPARMHLRTGIPIIVGAFVRTGVFSYKIVYAGEPLVFAKTGDQKADIVNCTQVLMSKIEELIRLYPEQYLWMHRRFRFEKLPERPVRK